MLTLQCYAHFFAEAYFDLADFVAAVEIFAAHRYPTSDFRSIREAARAFAHLGGGAAGVVPGSVRSLVAQAPGTAADRGAGPSTSVSLSFGMGVFAGVCRSRAVFFLQLSGFQRSSS